MRIIKGLNEVVRCVDQSFDQKTAPTYKKIVIDSLFMDRSDGENAIRSFRLGNFIYDCKGQLELSDENYNYIMDKLNRNRAGYPDFALGACIDVMLKAEIK